ncbi:MAG TPA: class 1 isoprenoid biosynthesis enzyme [Bacteroidota bacterium]|nr:class 1 isoprenoid biosynthesis enzyme [Bacteroidota bacterium]
MIDRKYDDEFFNRDVERWNDECLRRWNDTPQTFPEGLDRYSPEEQSRQEQHIEQTISRVSSVYEHRNNLTQAERAEFRDRMRSSLLGSLIREVDEETERFMNECERTAHEFADAANAFDSSLPMEDVHQALRNQWVFNSIQRLFERPLTMTPSSFAYSMLYPFTDNMIDAANQSRENIEAFLSWLSDRLAGVPNRSRNKAIVPVDRLIVMIEREFPRSSHPVVYQTLRAIHAGQKKGVLLRGGRITGGETELLAITFLKGGTSVLVDGCLISGDLDEELAMCTFLYGVALQMLDDLQDLVEDDQTDSSTAFTRAARQGRLEKTVNQFLNFLQATLASGLERPDGGQKPIIDLMTRSCLYLALEAIARQRQRFDAAYLSRIAEHMPLRIDYLAQAKDRMTGVVAQVQSRAAIIHTSPLAFATGNDLRRRAVL